MLVLYVFVIRVDSCLCRRNDAHKAGSELRNCLETSNSTVKLLPDVGTKVGRGGEPRLMVVGSNEEAYKEMRCYPSILYDDGPVVRALGKYCWMLFDVKTLMALLVIGVSGAALCLTKALSLENVILVKMGIMRMLRLTMMEMKQLGKRVG